LVVIGLAQLGSVSCPARSFGFCLKLGVLAGSSAEVLCRHHQGDDWVSYVVYCHKNCASATVGSGASLHLQLLHWASHG
jgi:hypothetical protein